MSAIDRVLLIITFNTELRRDRTEKWPRTGKCTNIVHKVSKSEESDLGQGSDRGEFATN